MTPTLAALVVLACLASEGFFSGSELAMVSADRLRLKSKAEAGSFGAGLALQLLERPTWLLGTCLIGTNLSMVSGTTVAAAALSALLPEHSEVLSVALMVPLILIFAELVPKSVFQHHADRIAPWVAPPLTLFSVVFTPVLWVLNLFTSALVRVVGEPQEVRREDIRSLLGSHEEVDLPKEDRELIQRVFNFSEARVEDAMKPLIDVVSVSEDASAAAAVALMVEHGYSRLPTYKDRVDQVTGLVHHSDLLFVEDLEVPVRTLARPPVFVPESKPVEQLFNELRRARQRVAIPVDEYGGAVGLITMEDILEEIVGEIDDEYDEQQRGLRKLGPDTWLVTARTQAADLLRQTGFELPEGNYDTVAGFMLHRLGKIPAVGERVVEGAWELLVHKANDRAILEVRLRRGDHRSPDPSHPRPEGDKVIPRPRGAGGPPT